MVTAESESSPSVRIRPASHIADAEALAWIETAASQPTDDYVFADRTDAVAFRSWIAASGASDTVAPWTFICERPDGQFIGGYTVSTPAFLARQRLLLATALRRRVPALDPLVITRLLQVGSALPSLPDGSLYLGKIAVIPTSRGAGYGLLLLGHALAIARWVGAPALALDVATDNMRAISVYEHLGFTERASVVLTGGASRPEVAVARMVCEL